ncbi:hypothetical protein G6F22_009577 [Rhizopus arrhizus]|nr:hypothetical protein G6F22_009577 [Rhizopus arrhizus]
MKTYIRSIAQGIKPAPNKVNAILSWPVPTNVQQVRQFIGLAQHYRRFIPGFADIASPLTDLTKGSRPKCRAIRWIDECQKSFDLVKKKKITTAPVLITPDMNKSFRIECDASDYAIGAVLLQEGSDSIWRPLAYESKKLSAAERNYPAQERELLSILHALRTWRCFIQSKPTPRLVRWLSEIELYNPVILYKPGAENQVPDILSRRDALNTKPSSNSMELKYLYNIVKESKHVSILDSDPIQDWPLHYLSTPDKWPIKIKKELEKRKSQFITRDKQVFKKVKSQGQEAYDELKFIPFAKRADLVYNFHRGYRHSGQATVWHLDFIGELPTTKNNNRWILMAVDYTTNWPIARALNNATAEEIVKFIYEEIVMRFGCPQEILTDRGANFMAKVVKQYIKKIKARHVLTSAFHPRTNGGEVHNWDEHIDAALFACRIRKHSTTGFSSFFLTYGVEPRIPSDIHRPYLAEFLEQDPELLSQDALIHLRKLQESRHLAEDRSMQQAIHDKKRWDSMMATTKAQTFNIDDYVLMRHENKRGLEFNWMGPYKVINRNLDYNIYQLQEVNGKLYASWVHTDRLHAVKYDGASINKTWYIPRIARNDSENKLNSSLA